MARKGQLKSNLLRKQYSTILALASRRHTRNATTQLPVFHEGLSTGKHIIVQVSNEERADNSDEDYFAAKIEENATKLEEDGTYSATPYIQHT